MSRITDSPVVRNAGKYRHKITIYKVIHGKDADGFPVNSEQVVISPYAHVKTTRGMTIITADSDFEKAFTNFTIRYPSVPISREMLIRFNDKVYTIEYLNDVDEKGVELEIQAKEVRHGG